ncbi:MAG: hypothetical protein OSA97_14420 [Nevskia sp.]|nr:hypothetical protein [Nevskia sp.]
MSRGSGGQQAAPSSREVPELREYLAQRRVSLARQGAELVGNWRQRFGKGVLPFSLVRLGGESNTLLRWRCTGAGCNPRGGRFELEQARDVIARLPAAVRARILDIEKARIELNYQYALAIYGLFRLDDLERRRTALAHLRRSEIAANSYDSRRV